MALKGIWPARTTTRPTIGAFDQLIHRQLVERVALNQEDALCLHMHHKRPDAGHAARFLGTRTDGG
jgi:hypothetical protein